MAKYFAIDGRNDPAAGSQLDPYLTPEYAFTQIADGELLIGMNGTYNDPDQHNFDGARGVVVDSENAYGVTLTASGVSRVTLVNPGASGIVFGKIIIDGEDTTANGIYTGASTHVNNMTLNGTHVLNCTTNGILADSTGTGRILSLIAKNGFKIAGSMSNAGFTGTPTTGVGRFRFLDGEISIDGCNSINSAGISLNPQVAGASLEVDGVDFNIGIASGTNTTPAIKASGVSNIHVTDFTVTNSGADGEPVTGVYIINHATITCDSCEIFSGTITLGATVNDTTAGYGVLIGSDGVSTPNINNAKVHGVVVVGTNHGIILGYIDGGDVYAVITNLTNYGIILKGGTGNRAFGSLIIDPRAIGLYDKGGTNDFACNNTVIAKVETPAFIYQAADSVPTNSTGFTAANNNCYSVITPTKWVVSEAGTATDTYKNNNFYSAAGLPSSPFSRNGSAYSTISLWEAAVSDGSDNTDDDPMFVNFDGGDYTLQEGSPLLGNGYRWWSGANPLDIDYEPFSDLECDIGNKQHLYASSHPCLPYNA